MVHDLSSILLPLQGNKVRCWYAPEDLKIGEKFQEKIEESIRWHDKLLTAHIHRNAGKTELRATGKDSFEKYLDVCNRSPKRDCEWFTHQLAVSVLCALEVQCESRLEILYLTRVVTCIIKHSGSALRFSPSFQHIRRSTQSKN